MTSGRLSLLYALYMCKFLEICLFKHNFELFFSCKLCFQPKTYPVNTLKASKLTQNGYGKSCVSVLKADALELTQLLQFLSKKEIENLTFCEIVFYFTHEHQKRYFHLWLRHSRKYCFCCSFGEIKIDLTLKKSNILYVFFICPILTSQL